MQLQVKIPENRTNKLFRGKQTTNKVASNIFRGLEEMKMVRGMFGSQNHSIKGKWNVFSGHKQRTRCTSCI